MRSSAAWMSAQTLTRAPAELIHRGNEGTLRLGRSCQSSRPSPDSSASVGCPDDEWTGKEETFNHSGTDNERNAHTDLMTSSKSAREIAGRASTAGGRHRRERRKCCFHRD